MHARRLICLAGDLFGEFRFAEPLAIGQRIVFCDVGAYAPKQSPAVQRPRPAGHLAADETGLSEVP